MTKRKTHEEFVQEVYGLVGEEYAILDNYVNSKTKVLLLHNLCGHKFKMKPNNFLSQNQRCPNCKSKKQTIRQTKSNEQFLKDIYDIYKNEYSILDKYKNSHTKILVKHNICNYQYKVYPYSLLNGHKCPLCMKVLPYTTKTFKDKIYELYENEYKVIGNYINSQTKILIEHSICKHKWDITPNNILRGYKCPVCNESKGERKIRQYLKLNNINFESQFTISDCKRKECLPFDFAILNNNKIILLIEYDGIYHYEPIYNKSQLKYQQENDDIKNNYCKNNNIPLLRIPYWEYDNIENILDNFLKEVINIIDKT